MISVPHGRHEPLAAGVAYYDIGKDPVPVPRYQVRGYELEEGMPRLAPYYVVAKRTVTSVGGKGGEIGDGIECVEASLQCQVHVSLVS